jgi:putative hydrolase of the HAD superfamily
MGFQLATIIFDGDDTLWSIQPVYDDAKNKFAKLMAIFPETPESIVSLVDQVDYEAVATSGFSQQRFPNSLIRTYEILAKRYDYVTREDLISQSRSLGEAVFTAIPQLYSDTLNVLFELAKDYRLILLTKGDLEVQTLRLDQLRLWERFDRVFIVPQKTIAEFAKILTQINLLPSQTWSIGNSLKSDILPAVKTGIHGILIPNSSWIYEHDNEIDGNFTVAQNLTEAMKIIRNYYRIDAIEASI